jgi:hypothetical protein
MSARSAWRPDPNHLIPSVDYLAEWDLEDIDDPFALSSYTRKTHLTGLSEHSDHFSLSRCDILAEDDCHRRTHGSPFAVTGFLRAMTTGRGQASRKESRPL